MLCVVPASATPGKHFSTPRWLATSALFVAAVVGVTAVPLALLHSPVRLYSGIFGAAAAVAMITSAGAPWRYRWQRIWLRWPAVAGVAALGLLVDSVTVPAYLALLVAGPIAITLGAFAGRCAPAVTPGAPSAG